MPCSLDATAVLAVVLISFKLIWFKSQGQHRSESGVAKKPKEFPKSHRHPRSMT